MENISKKVKYGIKWQFITNVAGQGVYFVTGIILARILSPRDFGIYGMSQVISNFTFMFWNLGLNAAIIQRKEISDEHLNTGFTISFFMGFICFAIISVSAPFVARFFREPIVAPLTVLIGSTFIIYAFDRIPSALLGRNLYFKEISLIGLASPVVYGLVAIPLSIMGHGPFSFALGVIAAASLMAIAKIYVSFRLFHWRPKFQFHKNSAKHLLGFGFFLTLQSMINFLFGDLQKILTGRFFGSVDLGYFNRASNLSSMPISKVRDNVGAVLLPAFSSIQDDRQKAKDWFRKFNFFTYSIISPVLAFFIFFPNQLIEGLVGAKWLPSAPILFWFSLAALFSVSDMFFSNMLNAIGKPHINFFIKLFMLLPFIAGVIIGLKWGIKGVAIALFINSILLFLSYMLFFRFNKLLGFFDYLISSFEPVLVSFIACILTTSLFVLVKQYIPLPEIKLLALLCIFGTIVIPYYANRWFRASYIGYLGFNVQEVVRSS